MANLTVTIPDGKLQFFKNLVENLGYNYTEKNEEKTVAYTPTGKPMSLKQYNESLKKAENQIENGQYTTIDQLKKEVKNWK